jgi:hypothetical protein
VTDHQHMTTLPHAREQRVIAGIGAQRAGRSQE